MDAAIYFSPDDVGLGQGAFYGRYAATKGIVLALARHGSGDAMHCVSTYDNAVVLRKLLNDEGLEHRTLIRLRRPTLDLANGGIGTLFRPDPNQPHMGWVRRAEGQERGFSLCGLTHTLVEQTCIRWLREMVDGPFHPWDAVICTSRAAQALCRGVMEGWQEHLAQRLGCRITPAAPVQLPVIPLGIDCAAFAPPAEAPALRAELRRRLDIAEDDAAVLFFGRLSYYEKAHPAPLYLALEAAARRSGRRFHLLQVGRFPKPEDETAYRAVAAALAPSVRCLVLDGSDAALVRASRSAADIFASLSDNVQETFGLTPVEAMAAGLPVVVSDWDGYRDTVTEETGFRIPTLSAPPGTGTNVAVAYILTNDYRQLLGQTSQATAVDISRAADAFAALAGDAGLRRRLGEAGRRRAQTHYDWSVVVPQYEALWAELAGYRRAGTLPAGPPLQLYPDPFELCGSFPSGYAGDDTAVALVDGWRARLAALLADTLCRFAAPTPDGAAALLEAFLGRDGRMLADLLAPLPAEQREEGRRLALWLAKMHVLAFTAPTPSPPGGAGRPDAARAVESEPSLSCPVSGMALDSCH